MADFYGRAEITTDAPEVTAENVVSILEKTMPLHLARAAQITNLLSFEAGAQPVLRRKITRPEINAQCVDNVAAEVADFWLGFQWGNTPTFVPRGEIEDKDTTEAVKRLNDAYEATSYRMKQQRLGRFVEIAGIGYTYIDINTEWEEGESYFTRDILDPRYAYIVTSTYYPDHRAMLGVTYREDENHNRHYTCFTKDRRFEITKATGGEWRPRGGNGDANPLHRIPIIERIRSFDRMGVFEKQLQDLNDLNQLNSNFMNAIEQSINSLWWTNDVDFPEEEVTNEDGTTTVQPRKPVDGEWMQTYTPSDGGRTPLIQPLVPDYKYSEMLGNIVTCRARILEKCHVPQRNDNSGGSTGIAMDDATGWNDAEMAASKEALILDGGAMEELKAVLAAIRESPYIKPDDPLLKLHASDVQITMKRQKSFEMSTKVNSIATLLSHGFSLEDVVATVPLFEDPSQVIQRSGEGVRKFQETVWQKQSEAEGGDGEEEPDSGRMMQDKSDQIDNSPMIDSQRTDAK